MQKITPHLWFDKEAKEAAAFYVSVFGDPAVTVPITLDAKTKINNVTTLHNTPSGDFDIVSFELA